VARLIVIFAESSLSMPAPPTLAHHSFLLREITVMDAAFVQALTLTPGWLKHIGDRGTSTLEGTYAYIQRAYTDAYAQHGFGLWAVVDRIHQIPMGVCGLVCRPDVPAPDLGFALLPKYEGYGWIRQASEVVLAYAQSDLRLKRVDAYANEDNVRSRKTLENLGFELNECTLHPSFQAIVCHYQKNLE
jgi:[ribosomal protein S5]-alanine N-acetyltransferase